MRRLTIAIIVILPIIVVATIFVSASFLPTDVGYPPEEGLPPELWEGRGEIVFCDVNPLQALPGETISVHWRVTNAEGFQDTFKVILNVGLGDVLLEQGNLGVGGTFHGLYSFGFTDTTAVLFKIYHLSEDVYILDDEIIVMVYNSYTPPDPEPTGDIYNVQPEVNPWEGDSWSVGCDIVNSGDVASNYHIYLTMNGAVRDEADLFLELSVSCHRILSFTWDYEHWEYPINGKLSLFAPYEGIDVKVDEQTFVIETGYLMIPFDSDRGHLTKAQIKDAAQTYFNNWVDNPYSYPNHCCKQMTMECEQYFESTLGIDCLWGEGCTDCSGGVACEDGVACHIWCYVLVDGIFYPFEATNLDWSVPTRDCVWWNPLEPPCGYSFGCLTHGNYIYGERALRDNQPFNYGVANWQALPGIPPSCLYCHIYYTHSDMLLPYP